jgi:hypothetical protein
MAQHLRSRAGKAKRQRRKSSKNRKKRNLGDNLALFLAYSEGMLSMPIPGGYGPETGSRRDRACYNYRRTPADVIRLEEAAAKRLRKQKRNCEIMARRSADGWRVAA